ncbi:hypothetical protein Goshw_002558 [Gossypium schwendimanii]|uniref:Uncharacterized protein n=4 Tax=Gossypium TaxID=3633 RepID=A0A7J9IFN8_9ROSI|nr:hypothetical protein [Gossypium raimondii]MBA0638939.1 hypothetical protein [Gossypium klotzschianum]MBA0820927.1 hypothetical protein [Gossypium armourianum]MBA0846469.1 hypothetical protein [Gossypium schwendimanii]
MLTRPKPCLHQQKMQIS